MTNHPNICVWYELDKNLLVSRDQLNISSSKHIVDILSVENSFLIRVPPIIKERNYYFPFPVKDINQNIKFRVFMEINSKIKTTFVSSSNLDESVVFNLYSSKKSIFNRKKIPKKLILNGIPFEGYLLIENIPYFPKLINTDSESNVVLFCI